jgi:hypothetical protein
VKNRLIKILANGTLREVHYMYKEKLVSELIYVMLYHPYHAFLYFPDKSVEKVKKNRSALLKLQRFTDVRSSFYLPGSFYFYVVLSEQEVNIFRNRKLACLLEEMHLIHTY